MFDVGSPMITSQDQSIVLNLYEKAKNLESNNTHKHSNIISNNELYLYRNQYSDYYSELASSEM